MELIIQIAEQKRKKNVTWTLSVP